MSNNDNHAASWIFIVAALLVLAAVLAGIQQCREEDCRAKKGRLIHVHSIKDPTATVCIEPEKTK